MTKSESGVRGIVNKYKRVGGEEEEEKFVAEKVKESERAGL